MPERGACARGGYAEEHRRMRFLCRTLVGDRLHVFLYRNQRRLGATKGAAINSPGGQGSARTPRVLLGYGLAAGPGREVRRSITQIGYAAVALARLHLPPEGNLLLGEVFHASHARKGGEGLGLAGEIIGEPSPATARGIDVSGKTPWPEIHAEVRDMGAGGTHLAGRWVMREDSPKRGPSLSDGGGGGGEPEGDEEEASSVRSDDVEEPSESSELLDDETGPKSSSSSSPFITTPWSVSLLPMPGRAELLQPRKSEQKGEQERSTRKKADGTDGTSGLNDRTRIGRYASLYIYTHVNKDE